jgi:hypothetical protein
MIRLITLAAALSLGLAASVEAQTYGQLRYYGGSLSELNGRAYAQTGAAATGYSAYGYSQGYGGYGYGHDRGGRYGYSRYRQDYRPGWSHGRRASAYQGYRDEYGYNDDRHPTRWRSGYGQGRYDDRPGHGCGCADVYLYDR